MTNRRLVETPIEDTFTEYLINKGKGEAGEEGAYRIDAKRELHRFRRWCLGKTSDPANASPPESWLGLVDDDTVRFTDLDTTVFSDYARYLSTADYAAGTVITYYGHIASWCGWAHAQGYLPRHYARESKAEDPLPRKSGQRPCDQQTWEPISRDLITQFVDRRVSEAVETLDELDISQADGAHAESEAWQSKQRARFEAYQRCREQALVYFVAYTGLRGSEFLSAPKEDREGRNGIRWRDVSFVDSSVTVFRKSREWKEVSLPGPLITSLKRYSEVLEVPKSWRMFTTLHRPSLASHTTDGLAEAGLDNDMIDRIRTGVPDLIVAAEHGLEAPKPLTTNGARSIMKRLWTHEALAERRDELDLSLDGDYFGLHGGCRDIGEVIIRQFGYTAAARYLDKSEEQVRELYQHIVPADRSDMMTKSFSQIDP